MQLRWDEIRMLVLVALGQLCLELRYVSTSMMKYGTTYAACLIQIRSAVNGLLVLSPGFVALAMANWTAAAEKVGWLLRSEVNNPL